MAKIAIMGFGTVGSGVLEVLRRNASAIEKRAGEPIEVKYILDIRDFTGHPDEKLFVKDLDVILNDPEVKAVVETIGGTKPSLDFVTCCLQSGRSVATSNKELVAMHGAQLMQIAKQNGAAFLFEASVGGGMPIITPMHQCLAANVIRSVRGIVNGTTNFILTKMERDGMDFAQALQLAQKLGYAETRDPSADVDGIDACRKISILAGIAFGKEVHPDSVPTKGIRGVTAEDIAAAAALGCSIKLIAWAKQAKDGAIAAGVEPMLVVHGNHLASVDDVFNAVLVEGDMLGDVVFYGKGAGKLPTASAVVADIIDALKSGASIHDSLYWEATEESDCMLTDYDANAYYIRVEGCTAEELKKVFPEATQCGETGIGAYCILPDLTTERLEQMYQKMQNQGWNPVLSMKLMAE